MMMIARGQGSHALGSATSNEATASLSLSLSLTSASSTPPSVKDLMTSIKVAAARNV